MQLSGALVFATTYVLISARRVPWLGIDRTGGALLGAVACVLLGVLTPARALAAIDGATLLLLFSVMGMGAFLADDDLFGFVEARLLERARTPERLLSWIVWGSGVASALITNDAVCVLGTPLVVRLIRRHQLAPLPFLLALATSANTGSVATLVGNPQNMLCGLLGGLTYGRHLLLMAPIAIAGLALNHLLLWLTFRRDLASSSLDRTTSAVAETSSETGPPRLSTGARITLAVIGATAVAYTFGGHLAWTAAAGFTALLLLRRRETRSLWQHVDWSLLLFFAGLFVVVEGLLASGLPGRWFSAFPLTAGLDSPHAWFRLSAVFLVGSNLVSNVPFILVVRDAMGGLSSPELGWELLAMAATFAGNLTLLGSVANVIVAEAGREVGGIGFFEYLRVGLPLAILTTLIGTFWLVLVLA